MTGLLPDPAPSTGGPLLPSLPGLPNLPVVPSGSPVWLVVLGYAFGLVALLATGGVLARLIDARLTKRRHNAEGERAEVEADEVFTKVAVTLVEPLRDRLARTEQRLSDAIDRADRDREAYDQQLDTLRGRVREALTEADSAVAEAHRLRRLVQQWHRAIMDPAATIEWLRQLVGPDEPAI